MIFFCVSVMWEQLSYINILQIQNSSLVTYRQGVSLLYF